MTAIAFGVDDFDNLELVRSIVLRRLKEDRTWQLLYDNWDSRAAGALVQFAEIHHRDPFCVLVDEVMWQLIIQGVITPGKDASNPALPWFKITRYGRQVLEAERFVAHDPTGYLGELRASFNTIAPDVAVAYVEEALRCFTSGCHVAAVLLLGVAAEAVFLKLCEKIASEEFNALPDHVKPRHRWLLGKYNALPRNVQRGELPESLDTSLPSLFDLIRRQRNELGHPQDAPPSMDREQAYMFFRLFPTYVADIDAFSDYCQREGV